MIHKTAERMALWCAGLLELEDGEQETILYGLEVFLDGVTKAAVLLTAGALVHRLPEFLAVLAVFCSLRYWAGGVHFSTNFGCLLAMLVMCAGSVLLAGYFRLLPGYTVVLPMPLLFGILAFCAPWQSVKNPIEDMGRLRRKKKGAFVWLSLECAAVLAVSDIRWKWVLLIPAIIEVFSIMPIWDQRRKHGGQKKCCEQKSGYGAEGNC